MAIADAVCTPAVPAPKINMRPWYMERPRLIPASQKRAMARLMPTSSRKMMGCRTPRLRGTMGHFCHSSKANSSAPYKETACPVANRASRPE